MPAPLQSLPFGKGAGSNYFCAMWWMETPESDATKKETSEEEMDTSILHSSENGSDRKNEMTTRLGV